MNTLTKNIFSLTASLVFICVNILCIAMNISAGKWLWAGIHTFLLAGLAFFAAYVYKAMLEWELMIASFIMSYIKKMEEEKRKEDELAKH